MLVDRHSYLDTSIDFIICDIIEYDMKSAGFSIIKAYNLLPKNTIDFLDKLDKSKRNTIIGKIDRKQKGLLKKVNEIIADYRVRFYIENELRDDDILSIKKDAIFTKRYCNQLEFSKIELENVVRPIVVGKDNQKDSLANMSDITTGNIPVIEGKDDQQDFLTNRSNTNDSIPMVVGKDNSQIKDFPIDGSIHTLTPSNSQSIQTSYDNKPVINFVPKNIYSAYLYLDKKEIYFNYKGLDIKGIDNRKLPLHEKYMMKFIHDMISTLSRYDEESFKRKLVAFADKYKRRELDINYYREFNTDSQFVVLIEDRVMKIDNLGDVSMCDISYNYSHIIIPLLGLII